MQATVGTPMMTLDRMSHFGQKGGRSGNARAVLCEALAERRCADEDFHPELSSTNEFYTFDSEFSKIAYDPMSGNCLADYWELLANSYFFTDSKGRERGLRSDANIGGAGIIKPNKDFMDTLSREEQLRFLDESMSVILKMLNNRGIIVDIAILHLDENNPHIHYFFHDPEYKLSKKLNLPFFKELNKTVYPVEMKKLGWDVKQLEAYDKDYADSLPEDQKDAYKASLRQKRNNRRSAKEYKADKRAEKILKQAKEQAESIISDAEKQRSSLDSLVSSLEAYSETLKAEWENIHTKAEKGLNELLNTVKRCDDEIDRLSKMKTPEARARLEQVKKVKERTEITRSSIAAFMRQNRQTELPDITKTVNSDLAKQMYGR